ncbi:MAG: DoxX family membrane protein [Planctomycetes bacterium]|nr:DoxX family membrane protein [Planctomycetota bacterium]
MLNLVQSKKKFPAVVSLLARLGVGGYFVYAAYTKIIAPEGFVAAIRSYEMLDPNVVPFMAFTLPWLELFAGLLLGLGIWVAEARGLVVAMLLAFIGATGVALAQGLEIDCGCTGENSGESGWTVIIRNSAFLALLTIDWLAMRCSRGVNRAGSDAVPA